MSKNCDQQTAIELCQGLQSQIVEALEFSIAQFRLSMPDRAEMTSWENPDPSEDEVFFDVELWSAYIAGYATRIVNHGTDYGTIYTDHKELIFDLKRQTLADYPRVRSFVTMKYDRYHNFISYIFMVDYLRMLVIEFVENCQS